MVCAVAWYGSVRAFVLALTNGDVWLSAAASLAMQLGGGGRRGGDWRGLKAPQLTRGPADHFLFFPLSCAATSSKAAPNESKQVATLSTAGDSWTAGTSGCETLRNCTCLHPRFAHQAPHQLYTLKHDTTMATMLKAPFLAPVASRRPCVPVAALGSVLPARSSQVCEKCTFPRTLDQDSFLACVVRGLVTSNPVFVRSRRSLGNAWLVWRSRLGCLRACAAVRPWS